MEQPFGSRYNTGYANDGNRLHTPNRLPLGRPPMFLDISPNVLGPARSQFKRCSRCGEYKSRGRFYIQRSHKDGLTSHCKECRGESSRKYASEHPDIMRESARRWRDANPQSVREINHRWYEKHANTKSEYNRKRYAENAESRRESSRLWREQNLEARLEYDRNRYYSDPDAARARSSDYNARHREERREYQRQYRILNPDIRRSHEHNRRARKLEAGGTYTAADLVAIRAAQTDGKGRLICWHCGKPIKGTPHLDHWIPLKHGGTNDAGNLHYMHAKCNLMKSAKMPAEIGRLI